MRWQLAACSCGDWGSAVAPRSAALLLGSLVPVLEAAEPRAAHPCSSHGHVLLGRAARAGCLRQGQDKAKARPPDPSHRDCQQRSQEGKLLGLLHNKTTAEQPSGRHPWKFFVVSHLEPPSAQPQKGMGWGQAPPNKEAGGIRCLYAAPWAHSGKLYRTLWHHLLNKVVLCF